MYSILQAAVVCSEYRLGS